MTPTAIIAALLRHRDELDVLRIEIKRMVPKDQHRGDPIVDAFHIAGGMVNSVERVAYYVGEAVRETMGGETKCESR